MQSFFYGGSLTEAGVCYLLDISMEFVEIVHKGLRHDFVRSAKNID